MKHNILVYFLFPSFFVLSSCVDEYWDGIENCIHSDVKHCLWINCYWDLFDDSYEGPMYQQSFTSSSQSFEIFIDTYDSVTDWKLSGLPDWITASKTSGNTSETIILKLSESDVYRTANLVITSSDMPDKWQLRVKQEGSIPLLDYEVNFHYSNYELSRIFICDPGREWFVRTNESWIKAQKQSDIELLITVEENTTGEIREGYIDVVCYSSRGEEMIKTVLVRQFEYQR